MLQKLLPVILIAVAGVAGGGGGYFAKTMMSGKTSASGEDGAHGEADDGHGEKKAKKGGHGGGHGEEDATSTTYMKFSRQFVVPVVHNGRPKSMVILDINIEVDSSESEGVYALEPRLRDAFLARLMALSGEGMLPQMLEDMDKLEYTKMALLEESRKIMGDAALDVLILDLGIQNY
ncbi:flagellar basal body-associated FliL family protein [Hyphococcus luteus]|uniref:Flagellar protein FliL n=1 Tax=Hyphococcus luteus TaxID=2058213 RepID=A0A2S7K4K8_9PROT|nr:flagellar basal body-associated FliL family protein [Marinicaulis flavus]PQA87416.1 hypothetical protein CW354_11465 [Marinicaulis flavus]